MKPNWIYNKKLLVEGKDDQHVIWALCEKFKVEKSFEVIDCEGIDKLIEQIPIWFLAFLTRKPWYSNGLSHQKKIFIHRRTNLWPLHKVAHRSF